MKNKLTIFAIIFSISLIAFVSYISKVPTQDSIKAINEEDKTIFMNLSAQEFAQKINEFKNSPDTVILDVRTNMEYSQGHIEGAQNLDFYNPLFKVKLNALDKNKRYFIYCRSGNRSGQTMQFMKELGFKEVYNLQFGINDWTANNLPLVQ